MTAALATRVVGQGRPARVVGYGEGVREFQPKDVGEPVLELANAFGVAAIW